MYPNRTINFNREDIDIVNDNVRFDTHVYADRAFTKPVASFSSIYNDQTFSYSKNNGPFTAFPVAGLDRYEFDQMRFTYGTGYFATPVFAQRNNIVLSSTSLDYDWGSQSLGDDEINSISVDSATGHVWVSTDNGDLYKFWGDPLRLKQSYIVDSDLLASHVDGKRGIVWLVYADDAKIMDINGQDVATHSLDATFTSVHATYIDDTTGKLIIGGSSFEVVDPVDGTDGDFSKEVTSIGAGADGSDTVRVTSAGSNLVETYDITTPGFSTYMTLDVSETSPRVASSGTEAYIVGNATDKLYAYDSAVLKWELDLPTHPSSEAYDVAANWDAPERGRFVYYFSRKKLTSVRDFVTEGKAWYRKHFAAGDTCKLALRPPEHIPHVWVDIRNTDAVDNRPVIETGDPVAEVFIRANLNEWQGSFLLKYGRTYRLELTGGHAYFRRDILQYGICNGTENYDGWTHDAVYRYAVPNADSGSCGDSIPDTHSNFKIKTGSNEYTADSLYSGDFRTDHVYEVFVTGEHQALQAMFDDDPANYLDNIGGCTIKIYEYY